MDDFKRKGVNDIGMDDDNQRLMTTPIRRIENIINP